MRIAFLITILAGVALLAGCGSSSDSTLPVSSLQIFPGNFAARVGDVVALGAVATYANGSQAQVSDRVRWQTSDATVASISAGGELRALAPGQTQVSAMLGAVASSSFTVDVAAVPVLPTAPYLPMGFGYYWQYTGTEVTAHSVRSMAEPITLTQSIQRQVVRDGTVWYELLVKGSDPQEPPSRLYMRHDPEGLMWSELEGWLPVKLLDASLAVNATWEDPDDPRRTFVIESITERVQVPAGVFDDCVKVVETDTYYDPPKFIKVWFKAGVGIVWEQVFDGLELILEQKLVRAQLGRP